MRSETDCTRRVFICCLAMLVFGAVSHLSFAQNPYTVIFDSDSTRVYYPRIMEIHYSAANYGTLLATCEEYIREMPVHPIYRSTDRGKTWERFSEVRDTQHGWGMRYQPFLFELPQQVGDLRRGTILCAGSAIPMDMSQTSIDLYMSSDYGKTWEFMSTVCQGGRATPNNREDPVWEPFLMLDEQGRLVCFVSDERDPSQNQLLCHYVSEDGGYTWGPQVNDITLGKMRPGMPIITKLPNGQYFYAYEMVKIDGHPLFYRYSDDGVNWGDPFDYGTMVMSVDGVWPGGRPYCIWTPVGGPDGMVIVSGQNSSDTINGEFFVNYDLGEGSWYRMWTPIRYEGRSGAGYSRSMLFSTDSKELYSVVNLPNDKKSRLNLVFYRFPLEPTSGWYHKITAECSFRNLEVQEKSTASGTPVVQWDNSDSLASQEWLLEDAGDGYVRLTNGNSGKVLEVSDRSNADGAPVIQGDWGDRDNQKWKLEYLGEGFYTLTASHSGKCLSVPQNSFSNGVAVVQSTFTGAGGQKWRIDPVNCDDPSAND